MRYPEFLKDNGTIGFVAPSFGCNIEPYKSAFNNALNKFEEKGYKLDLGPNCYSGEGIGISSTPEKCGHELTEYYCSENNDVLMSCGGGELMCETLEYVDFEKIAKANPKWYMGYSDNTNMTFLLTTLCDTASIYGPCAPAFGMDKWHKAIEDAFNCISGKNLVVENYEKWEKESLKNEENPLLPYNVTEKTIIKKFVPSSENNLSSDSKNVEEKSVKAGYDNNVGAFSLKESFLKEVFDSNISMQGRLLGGCMDCLVNLIGTKFDKVKEFNEKYKNDGVIWFLESCDLNVFAIRRAIWQMINAGWFDSAKGFIIGRPLVFGQEMFGLNQYNAVTDLLARFNVPVIMDADIGHLAPMMPLVCGSYANVESNGSELKIDMQMK